MLNKLNEIVEHKKQEINQRKQKTPEAMLYLQLTSEDKPRSFYESLFTSKKSISLIAEIKHKSPSAGSFESSISAVDRALEYEKAAVDAISYVSDNHFFGGSLDELEKIKKIISIPVLQKDFIIDMYQVVEAAIKRVDALLLIARILEPRQLRSFVDFAQINNVEPVVEVYSKEDLEKALQTNTRIIGVNARNLDTFEVDIEGACELLSQIPNTILKIGFSGVESKADVEKFKKAKADAVLVGSTLMKSQDINKSILELSL